ncbi:MAG: hypothetical protein EBR82_36340 [Caulobacteraceae bacterium]|nr:hypothetical protein [Caulobacteraceae bacterium]
MLVATAGLVEDQGEARLVKEHLVRVATVELAEDLLLVVVAEVKVALDQMAHQALEVVTVVWLLSGLQGLERITLVVVVGLVCKVELAVLVEEHQQLLKKVVVVMVSLGLLMVMPEL